MFVNTKSLNNSQDRIKAIEDVQQDAALIIEAAKRLEAAISGAASRHRIDFKATFTDKGMTEISMDVHVGRGRPLKII